MDPRVKSVADIAAVPLFDMVVDLQPRLDFGQGHWVDRTTEQDLEMVDCSLSLIEGAVFSKRQLERLRTILKRLASSPDENTRTRSNAFWARLRALESGNDS